MGDGGLIGYDSGNTLTTQAKPVAAVDNRLP